MTLDEHLLLNRARKRKAMAEPDEALFRRLYGIEAQLERIEKQLERSNQLLAVVNLRLAGSARPAIPPETQPDDTGPSRR